MPYSDIEEGRRKHAEYMRKVWYPKNRKKHVKAVARNTKQWRVKRRQEFYDLKRSLKCLRCPESHPACLDFHHRDPTKKSITIQRAFEAWSMPKILDEIAKCDVLCSNCHRKLHYDQRQKKIAG